VVSKIDGSPRGPAHLPTTEQVYMEVKDALTTILSDVGHQAIAVILQAQRASHFCRSKEETTEQLSVFDTSIRNRNQGLAWNHEDMNRRLRLNVSKGDDMLIFIELL
jgi:hypothetical protein